jgi:hypothetical protein
MKFVQPLFAILACAAALDAQAQTIERMKMTDGDLNCQQIFTEIKQMDVLIAQANAAPAAAAPSAENAAAQQVAGAVAQQAMAQVAARSGFGGLFGGGGGSSASSLLGGGGGGLGGLFGGMAQQAVAPAPVAVPAGNPALAQQAAGRKEHLTGLFLGKQCKMSDVK